MEHPIYRVTLVEALWWVFASESASMMAVHRRSTSSRFWEVSYMGLFETLSSFLLST
jgi:hypothetical protein